MEVNERADKANGSAYAWAASQQSVGVGALDSTLSRLYMYSKDTSFIAQENFTTEALAACIRADSDPMLIALRALTVTLPRLKGAVGEARWMRVRTQVPLPSGGILDGVLTYGDDRRVLGEIWLEVKIASPEGLGQLAGYVRAAADQTGIDDLPRDVVALSKVPLQRSAMVR